jgi:hypothetical protein
LKSEFIRIHAPIAAIKLDHFPGGPEDCGVPLSLPVFDIERSIELSDASKPLHHELESLSGWNRKSGLRFIIALLAAGLLSESFSH